MSVSSRPFGWCLAVALCVVVPACHSPHKRHLAHSQMLGRQMYLQNQYLAAQQHGVQGTLGTLAADKQRLEQENQALKANLDLANQRLDNLASSNNQLSDKYRDLLTSNTTGSPLSDDQTRRLEELRQKYPEFEFDPQTGISKFSTDLLFASGSDEITPRSLEILRQFSTIMNNGDAQHLKILVVGHTDDQPIAKARVRHQTNWHLSTNRAVAVVLAMRKAGLAEARMEAAGYGEHQPLTPNTSDAARQQNRRVEIFILAPDTNIAGFGEIEPLK